MCSALPGFLADPGLPNLRELSCDKNRLTEVPSVVASDSMRGLQLLSLAHNYIAEVPPWVSSLEAIKTLNLEGNLLLDLPLDLRALTRLLSLNLAHNRLDVLPLYVPTHTPRACGPNVDACCFYGSLSLCLSVSLPISLFFLSFSLSLFSLSLTLSLARASTHTHRLCARVRACACMGGKPCMLACYASPCKQTREHTHCSHAHARTQVYRGNECHADSGCAGQQAARVGRLARQPRAVPGADGGRRQQPDGHYVLGCCLLLPNLPGPWPSLVCDAQPRNAS